MAKAGDIIKLIEIDLETLAINESGEMQALFTKSHRTQNFVILESDDKLEVIQLSGLKKQREITKFKSFELNNNDDNILVHYSASTELINVANGEIKSLTDIMKKGKDCSIVRGLQTEASQAKEIQGEALHT